MEIKTFADASQAIRDYKSELDLLRAIAETYARMLQESENPFETVAFTTQPLQETSDNGPVAGIGPS